MEGCKNTSSLFQISPATLCGYVGLHLKKKKKIEYVIKNSTVIKRFTLTFMKAI